MLKRCLILLGLNFSYEPANAGVNFSGVSGSLNFDKSTSGFNVANPLTLSGGILKVYPTTATSTGSVTGASNITMNSGSQVQVNLNKFYMQGTYVPGSSAAITLNNGDYITMDSGNSVLQAITVASGATATIVGTPSFSALVTLTDATSILNLAVNDKLEKNVALGGGKIVLLDDLSIKSNVQFTGNGTVDLAQNQLYIDSSVASSTWTGNITFTRAKNLKISGQLTLTGTWTFSNANSDYVSVVSGSAGILDLSGGGTIAVAAGQTLYISNVHLKFGSTGGFSLAAGTPSLAPGKVVLSDSTIELTANYTQSSGQVYIQGGRCSVISGGNKNFTISGVDGQGNATKLTVDGCVLHYETLGGTNSSPFATSSGGLISTINGGVIRSNISDIVAIDTQIEVGGVNNGLTVSLAQNFDLWASSKIYVSNSASPTEKSVVVDGGGYIWTFPGATTSGSSDLGMLVDANVTVVLQNVYLDGFDWSNVSLGSNSVLWFGDGCVVKLGNSTTVSSAQNKFYCVGDAVIVGNGQTVTATIADSITAQAVGNTLAIYPYSAIPNPTFINLNIYNQHATGVSCGVAASVMTFDRCDLVIQRTASITELGFSTGNITFNNYCRLRSQVTNVINDTNTVNFKWLSTGTLSINAGSTLEVGKGVKFFYNPSDGSNNRVSIASSGVLFFNDCYVDTATPTNGFLFNAGTLMFDNSVSVAAGTTAAKAFQVSNAANVEVLASALVQVDGIMKYIA